MHKIAVFFLLALSFALCGFSQSPETTIQPAYLIDNFEDSNYTKAEEWWTFGSLNLACVKDPAIGKYSLKISGKTNNWYIGGLGVYLGGPKNDLSQYSEFVMDVYGKGEKSGTLKIELYDDDNRNWQVEQDPSNNYEPLYDDRFYYELKVGWKGWKHIVIPFSEFKDINPKAGDNIWDPNVILGSGGLLQAQIIVIAPQKSGQVELYLDNIGLDGRSTKY